MNNTLLIGTGGCGNKLLNTAIDILSESFNLKSAYDYRFVNSNANEMSMLPNYDAITNGLIINGDGTGRSREKAKASIGSDKTKILNHFINIIDKYTSVLIMSSADGGFGNGSIFIIANVIKQLNSNIPVNLLIAMPRLSSSKAGLENSISLYQEILEMRKANIVNSVQFIDNDKMRNEDSFNKNVMTQVINSLELGGGSLDSNDSLLINSANRYKVILPLQDKYKNLVDAIDASIKDSPFVMPTNLVNCSHLGAIFQKGNYQKEDVHERFRVKEFDKTEYGDMDIIVLGGCVMPDDHVKLLSMKLDELNSTGEEEESTFEINTQIGNKSNVRQETKQSATSNKDKLKGMINASFWGK